MDDDAFTRMTARNADDIRATILRNLRKRTARRVVLPLAVIAAVAVTWVVLFGWVETLAYLTVITLIGVACGWWSWHRKHATR